MILFHRVGALSIDGRGTQASASFCRTIFRRAIRIGRGSQGRVTFMHFDAAFTHRGYLLNCAPARAGDGTYQPYVVISRSSDGELVANRFFPAELRFDEEADAIAHARDWAVRWIDASSITI
jgi:hypothetical protein